MVAHELGVALERVVVVQPPPEQWAAAVAAVIGAFDIVLAGPPRRLSNADARRLMSRARERGSVLMALAHTRAWPERVDAQVSLSALQWDGLGHGHGHLLSRVIQADVSGRREFSRPRQCELVLPDARGGLTLHHREIDVGALASAANE
jgi:hypothetical protein